MTVIKGTLKTAVTPSTAAQTVVLLVGATTTTVTGCYIVGDTSMPLSVGTPMLIIKNGSAPYSSNFSVLSVQADNQYSGSTTSTRRTVPMTNTGVLSNSIAFPGNIYSGYSTVELLYPPSSSSGYQFVNGLEVYLGAFPPTYNIAWPTTATTPTSTVTFGVGEIAPFSFLFTARGAKNTMTIGGSGNAKPLTIAAGLDIAGAVFVSASLYINQHTYTY